MKPKKTTVIFVIYAVLLLSAVLTIAFFTIFSRKDDTVKVGFITTGNIDDAGWNSVNYRCVSLACEEAGAELMTASEVDEYGGHCKYAVEDMVKNGAEIIILNSSVLADQMRDLFHNYPDVSFYGADADFDAANFSAYSSRMYQVRYLSGIVAGLYTTTGKIGFVASYREPSAYRGVNAFALGVQSVNPDAEVIVAWTNDWENEAREKELAKDLIERENADLLTYHQHKPYVIETAEQYGVASIGYYDPVDNVSDKYLTCAMCDWTLVYEKMLRSCMSGQGNATKSEWMGIESGNIMLTPFSPLVPAEAEGMVARERQRIIEGWQIFSGEIYDNEGNERCCEGEAVSDITLLHEMDWLVRGVREYAE